MPDQIVVKGARLHNLKAITVSIPKNQLVVLTGLSGSGKSTLAFDILHKEGQRQYMESLGMVDYFGRPPIEGISGLSPSISVDQQNTNRSPRSTVGTVTDVYTYLRILFARLGHRPCPACGGDVAPSSFEAWDDEANGLEDAGDTLDLSETYPCPHCGAPVPELGMAHFSFNKPAGACPTCTGLGTVRQPNLSQLLDPQRSVAGGGVLLWNEPQAQHYGRTLCSAGQYYGFEFDLHAPIGTFAPPQRDLLLYGTYGEPFRRHFPHTKPPMTVGQGSFEGIVTALMRRYADHARYAGHARNPDSRDDLEHLLITQTCPDCRGDRLRPESRAVTMNGQTIIALSRMSIAELATWLEGLPAVVRPEAQPIIASLLDDLGERVHRLLDVGAGYLTLLRASPTLSAGEAQRLRLAALLGSGLTGVLYVLDEPTIGLHQRDTQRLVRVLRQLRDLGNTVLVIEHDLSVVRAADHVIDMGPGAGTFGGQIVATGSPDQVAAADTPTGRTLSGRATLPTRERRHGSEARLVIHGAREHNLKDITVALPLGMLVAVTGVAGSGKSSLMLDILDRAARQRFYGAGDPPGEHLAIAGWEHLDKVITLDQSAIGRTPRSNAATYTDSFTPIRQAFAGTAEAHARGLNAGHFSFNTPGGRCERCQGGGTLTVTMHFMPDVQVRCPACHGKRFKREVLEVRYRGHTIADVLDMSIAEAAALFADVPAAYDRLALMDEVGMGYLKLGQPATTLSGGEAQRVKLARELARRATGHTLYLLDEPTTGLHAADVANLLNLLHGLVDAGNSVVVIEHNLDVIRASDWVIDLGPEGGDAGGEIVAQGAPEDVARVMASHTGRYLQEMGV
ncbi:MAG: excinuclease ABC subunit UvrA [Anaerolineae bacterium]|nr:excinuclease ABC subunit UvrA [Anaerolineae bacterium]